MRFNAEILQKLIQNNKGNKFRQDKLNENICS